MKILSFIFLGLGFIFLALFCKERVKAFSPKAVVLKSLASAAFMGIAISALFASVAGTNNTLGFFVIFGLLFGLFGDIWLDLKWVYPNDNKIWTFSGFYVFAVQHVLIVIGLFLNFIIERGPKFILVSIIMIVVGVAAGALNVLFLEKPMKLNYGEYKKVSGFYGGILISMPLLLGALAIMTKFHYAAIDFMFFGEVFFLISDLILSGTYFGEGKDRPIDVITNHATYYIGQFLIALSLLFI